MENELDAYLEEHLPPMHDMEGTEESGQPSNIANFPYERPYYYDYVPSASSSRELGYDYTHDDPPTWRSYQSWN
jgi:hypothetical protein